jgi:predicted AAA+ superfamily ATPase
LSTPKFLFFDIGVRHAAAGLRASREIVRVNPGVFFEQWVGIELWKRVQYLGEGRLHYSRTRDGMEVDYIVEH